MDINQIPKSFSKAITLIVLPEYPNIEKFEVSFSEFIKINLEVTYFVRKPKIPYDKRFSELEKLYKKIEESTKSLFKIMGFPEEYSVTVWFV